MCRRCSRTAVTQRLADILQPDIDWAGGVTGLLKICHIAEAAGIAVIPHAGLEHALRPAFLLCHAERARGASSCRRQHPACRWRTA